MFLFEKMVSHIPRCSLPWVVCVRIHYYSLQLTLFIIYLVILISIMRISQDPGLRVPPPPFPTMVSSNMPQSLPARASPMEWNLEFISDVTCQNHSPLQTLMSPAHTLWLQQPFSPKRTCMSLSFWNLHNPLPLHTPNILA